MQWIANPQNREFESHPVLHKVLFLNKIDKYVYNGTVAKMLQIIKDLSNTLLEYVKDDPVRPNLSVDFRVSEGRMVIALVEEEKPSAMVCVSLHDFIPSSVDDLYKTTVEPTAAIFYTIWSYKPGSGQELLFNAVEALKEQYPSLNRFVTLSPKTEMARKFHLRNGAEVFRENPDTVNYEYHVNKDA